MADKRVLFYHHISKMKNIRLLLSGFHGTEEMTASKEQIKFKGTLSEFLSIHQPYKDILKEYDLYDYQEVIYRYVNCSKPYNIKNINDGMTYLIYLVSFANCQQSYMGIANQFIPVYSPYYDLMDILLEVPARLKGRYKIQRMLYERIMQKELREINTTHGYPSCEVTWKNFYRFWRLYLPFADYNLQYYTLYERIKRYVVKYLVYYSPYLGWFFNIIKRFSDRDFSFLDRDIELYGVDKRKFKKVLMDKQQLDYLKKLDKQLKVFMDK